jgi:predicted transposase YbfD/YdcC
MLCRLPRSDDKSNEITALRELIDTLELKGATVTVDALHCQKTTAQTIVDKGAEYVFGLKGIAICKYSL